MPVPSDELDVRFCHLNKIITLILVQGSLYIQASELNGEWALL